MPQGFNQPFASRRGTAKLNNRFARVVCCDSNRATPGTPRCSRRDTPQRRGAISISAVAASQLRTIPPSTGRGRGGRLLDFAARGFSVDRNPFPSCRGDCAGTPIPAVMRSRLLPLRFRVDARVARERPLGGDLRSASHQRWRRAQLSFACRFDRIGLVRQRC